MNKKDTEVNIDEKFGLSDSVDAELIKVTAIGPDQKRHEESFTLDVSSATMITISTQAITTTTTAPPPEQMEQLTEIIDFAKSHKPFINKFKISFDWKGGFQFEIERTPSQVTKIIKKS